MKTLKEGDVVFLNNGFEIDTLVPEKFIYTNRKLSDKQVLNKIVVGKKYYNETNPAKIIKSSMDSIIGVFENNGLVIKNDDVQDFIMSRLPTIKKEAFIVEKGEFVVFKVYKETMSYNGGEKTLNKIYCKRLVDGVFDENEPDVIFYNNHSMYGKIIDVKPIRSMNFSISIK